MAGEAAGSAGWQRLLPRGPIGGWALGWGLAAALLIGSGASHGWSDGGMALGLGGALAGWLVGGLATSLELERRSVRLSSGARRALAAGWVLSFAAAALSGWQLGLYFEGASFGGVQSAGFIGLVAGAGIGGAVGGLALALVLPHGARSGWSAFPSLVVAWTAAFGLGLYAALVAGLVLGELAKRTLEPLLGWYPGFVLGWGLGGALGGALAGLLGRVGLRLAAASTAESAAGGVLD